MYHLLQHNHNRSLKSGGLWNYYWDKVDDVDANDSASDGKSFEYKAKIVGETPDILPQLGNPRFIDQPAQLPAPFFKV